MTYASSPVPPDPHASIAVVGPSHVVRWKQIIDDRGLSIPPRAGIMFGRGGMPVWSKRLFEIVEAMTGEAVLLVGDFRFGNAVALDSTDSGLFRDGFTGIQPEAMEPTIDIALKNRSIAALKIWQDSFRGRVRFVFWDLLCRQVLDRLQGRHVADGRYSHPHWNLADVQAQFDPDVVIDLVPLVERRPMHEVMRLFIDHSGHPSRAGYDLLANLIFDNAPTLSSFDHSIARAENELLGAARALCLKHGDLILSGQSVWLETMVRCLGPAGVRRVDAIGMSLRPAGAQLGHVPHGRPAYNDSGLVRVQRRNDEGLVDPASVAAAFAWQAAAAQIIRARTEQPVASDGTPDAVSEVRPLVLASRHIELGAFGHPTHDGMLYLLAEIGTAL